MRPLPRQGRVESVNPPVQHLRHLSAVQGEGTLVREPASQAEGERRQVMPQQRPFDGEAVAMAFVAGLWVGVFVTSAVTLLLLCR